MNLNELRDNAHRIAVEHGFTDASIGEDLMLMVSELAEALEDHRNGREPNAVWYEDHTRSVGAPYSLTDGVPNKPCGIPSEIADVIIRCLHFCGKHGIDIDRAVREKMKYNESRPHKHGGKKL